MISDLTLSSPLRLIRRRAYYTRTLLNYEDLGHPGHVDCACTSGLWTDSGFCPVAQFFAAPGHARSYLLGRVDTFQRYWDTDLQGLQSIQNLAWVELPSGIPVNSSMVVERCSGAQGGERMRSRCTPFVENVSYGGHERTAEYRRLLAPDANRALREIPRASEKEVYAFF